MSSSNFLIKAKVFGILKIMTEQNISSVDPVIDVKNENPYSYGDFAWKSKNANDPMEPCTKKDKNTEFFKLNEAFFSFSDGE